MKLYITIGLAVVLSLGIIAGCTGTGGTGRESSGNNGSAAPAAPAAPAEPAVPAVPVEPAAPAEPAVPVEPATPAAPEAEPARIRLGGLKGPTTIGMVKLLEDAKAGKTGIDYQFTIAGAADELTPALIRGELDIVAIPANLASVLYNNTGGAVRLLAVNTLGVTYIVDTGGEIGSFADLKGKTVYCTGKGAVPEFALRYLLKENGVDPDNDLTLEWKSEPPEVVAMLAQSGGVAMLPQPYVTVAQNALPGLRIALDMTEEWNALDNGSMLITGVLAVNRDFAQAYPERIQLFLEEYKASTEYVNANVPEAAVMVEAYDIVKAPIAEIAIPYCNIFYLDGEEMEKAVSGYLEVLYAQNPKSVGETLPGDDFYYKR